MSEKPTVFVPQKLHHNYEQMSDIDAVYYVVNMCQTPVAYLGYGRHGSSSCHGRHFEGSRKKRLAQI